MKAGRAPVPLELEDMPLPLNTFKNKSPFTGTVKSVERIVGPNATGETCHIIIEHGGKMPFWEGQSYGVIPPGTKVNSKGKEVPHGVRLYSIASTRYGDEFDGKTAGNFATFAGTDIHFSTLECTVNPPPKALAYMWRTRPRRRPPGRSLASQVAAHEIHTSGRRRFGRPRSCPVA